MKRCIAIIILTLCVLGAQAQETHSANKALVLSLVPGGGQIYNRQAWKVPIIYGALGAMGYLIYDNYTEMSMYKEEYLYRVNNNGATQLAGYESYPDANIYNMYQSYNKNFQLMVIIGVAMYGLNLIDAYVFGHLFDFQMDDNLTLNCSPGLLPTGSGLTPSFGVTLSF